MLRGLFTTCRNLKGSWEPAILEKTSHLIALCKAREALRHTILSLREPEPTNQSHTPEPRYQVSSLFLKESWEYLVSAPCRSERLHLVTGTVTAEGIRVLSSMQKLEFRDQSPAYVCAGHRNAHQTIISLDKDFGHLVLGMFHSHVSSGARSTSPSSIDTAFLERMSKLGCDCLGAIFSTDGYVRFYSLNDFELDIYGKGLVKTQDKPSDKIFHIHKDVGGHES